MRICHTVFMIFFSPGVALQTSSPVFKANISLAGIEDDEMHYDAPAIDELKQGDNGDEGDKSKLCLPQNSLFFGHIMKTGGLSVDAYLKCRCEAEGCAVFHDEGVEHVVGDQACVEAPSICTSHAPAWDMRRCKAFADAKKFTVLRHPVERILSFYNYVRTPRPDDNWPGYQPYLDMSLEEVLRSWGVRDLDEGIPEDRNCYYCANETSNRMVMHYFTTWKAQDAHNKWNLSAGVAIPPDREAMRYQLAEAKRKLGEFEAIFIGPANFEILFELSGLMPTHEGMLPAPTNCQVPHENPTQGERVEPTETEMQLLRDLNWADIELYEYALTLPSVRRL